MQYLLAQHNCYILLHKGLHNLCFMVKQFEAKVNVEQEANQEIQTCSKVHPSKQ